MQSDHVGASVNNWVMEIRQLGYETEDILKSFVIKVSSKRNKRGFACIFHEWLDVHRVGCEIDASKTKITGLTTSLHAYSLKSTDEGTRNLAFEKQQELRQSYQHIVEGDFVGFEEDLNTVVEHLTQHDNYTPNRVRGHAYLSSTKRDILQEIFITLVPERKEEVVKMRNEELFEHLYEVQQKKKCLVVLDDIWSVEAWKSLRLAFPNGNTGSKILLTTHNKALASKIDPCYFHHDLRCLNEKESWDQLEKKAF
ncbi:hypothetical protein ACSBR2_041894 [Camellia fascicularis]